MAYLVKVGIGKLLRGMSLLDARAVDEDADLVAIGENSWHKLRNIFLGAEIGRVDGSRAAQGPDGFKCIGRCLVSLFQCQAGDSCK